MIRGLGYLGFAATDMNAWSDFAQDVLGTHRVDAREDGTVVLRVDEYDQRILLHPDKERDDLSYIGWETADEAELDAVRNCLADAGVEFTEGSDELASLRQVRALIQLRDPDGNQLEVFYGPTITVRDPFRSPVAAGPFVTGEQGLGHIVVNCKDYEAMNRFYLDVLQFRISDYCDLTMADGTTQELAFMYVNPRHHSLALGQLPDDKTVHHIMLQTSNLDDTGRAYDRARDSGAHLLMDLGRHSNDRMLSFYVTTPSGWAVEYGWGAIEIDEKSWHVVQHTDVSLWGHRYSPPPATLNAGEVQ